MADRPLETIVPEDEALRYVGDLRSGGRVGLTDERLLVVRDEPTSIELSDVQAVEMEEFDWFVAILSVALVGFGLYGFTRNPPVGVLFAVAGVASIYWSYRTREKATVRVHSRPKPLDLYPADASAFLDAFQGALEEYRARHDLDRAGGG